ncbi:MAG TPA: amino acid adenylation domain-containing protein [Bacteroidia bacterium]
MDKAGKLYQLLDVSAEKAPDATALIFQQKHFSYNQLSSASKKLQALLHANGIGEGDRVAIYTAKSIEFVISQFAILRAGAAYLPIDFNAPIERNKFIIEDCEAKAIIIHKKHSTAFADSFVFVAELEEDLQLLKSKKECSISPIDLAYILYTSGSTGRPKGVMYSHAAALEFINWSSDVFTPAPTDRFSSHAPFHFDLSIFDLFVSIKHGAALVLIDENTAKQPLLLAQLIAEKKISIWYSTPTILTMLSTFGKMHKFNCDSLRLVLFAGEVFSCNQFLQLKEYWNKARYFNLYGPTETNVCTYYEVDSSFDFQEKKQFPIGKCCEHYQAQVLNSGELCISGNGIMLGYWQAEEQNNTAFFTDKENRQWYKTGDLVEKNPDGNLIYKGRIDRMVKRNGYRIELSEIEAALHQHPGIKANAVLSFTTAENTIAITAFVSCISENDESIIKMKEYCTKHLPLYMIPNNFIFLKSLPQTASNKIDYQQLKQLI